jgi:opacity protein-like surface antigen
MVITGAAAMLAGAGVASAQGRWSVELSGGAAFATEKIGDADLNTGFGLGLTGRYRFLPHLAVYGGWDWHHFTVDQPVGGEDVDIEDTGYTFGLRFEHPLVSRVAGWVRAGGTANHIELENESGSLVSDSGHGLGWEIGGGLSVPIGTRLTLTPGVRYRSLSRDVEIGGVTTPTDLRYVVAGAGIALTF